MIKKLGIGCGGLVALLVILVVVTSGARPAVHGIHASTRSDPDSGPNGSGRSSCDRSAASNRRPDSDTDAPTDATSTQRDWAVCN